MWHFENNTSNDPSVELDLEEVKELARKVGFDIKVGCDCCLNFAHAN